LYTAVESATLHPAGDGCCRVGTQVTKVIKDNKDKKDKKDNNVLQWCIAAMNRRRPVPSSSCTGVLYRRRVLSPITQVTKIIKIINVNNVLQLWIVMCMLTCIIVL
jgi:hypothetical protein